jgi:hypothetical protein
MENRHDLYGSLWTVDDDELGGMTPEEARDLMVECFYVAQVEMFERTRMKLSLPPNDEEIRRTVTSAVRRAFEEVGYDFDVPIAAALRPVAECLKKESAAYGTPAEQIEEQAREYEKVLVAVERAADFAA